MHNKKMTLILNPTQFSHPELNKVRSILDEEVITGVSFYGYSHWLTNLGRLMRFVNATLPGSNFWREQIRLNLKDFDPGDGEWVGELFYSLCTLARDPADRVESDLWTLINERDEANSQLAALDMLLGAGLSERWLQTKILRVVLATRLAFESWDAWFSSADGALVAPQVSGLLLLLADPNLTDDDRPLANTLVTRLQILTRDFGHADEWWEEAVGDYSTAVQDAASEDEEDEDEEESDE
jgi:hypothetical protein